MSKGIASNHESEYYNNCFDKSAFPSLRAYFDRVVEGQPEVYDTPFARGESTDDLIGRWMDVLKSISDRWPSLWDYEVDLAKKVGPMSVMKPLRERMDDIDSYYEGILLPSEPIDHRAIARTISELDRIRGLSLRAQYKTNLLMKKSTNSGSPYFKKRRLVQGETLPVMGLDIIDDNVLQYLDNGNKTFGASAVLGWRGQEGGRDASDVKQRVVWMFPYAVNIMELTAYQPLIESIQRFNIYPSWVGMDAVDKRITDMFDTKSGDDLVVCTDFSAFDQHFGAPMQNAASDILQKVLDNSWNSKEWLKNVFPVKYMIPLAYDEEKVRFGRHGMGSGSGGTNADETLAHRSLQFEAAMKSGAYLNLNSQCLGDDGVLTYPGITVEDVVKAYTSHGLVMNEDKQYASTQDCIYLRRWHHKDYRVNGVCVGVYSTCRALGRLRYLERYQNPKYWDAKAVALRQLSILENVKWHPLRDKFVDFCMERDKYRLGVDIPHFLDNIRAVAQEKIDSMPDFLGYTKTLQSNDPLGGIENWWIIQYLKSK